MVSPGTPVHVLVVDDSVVMRRVVSRALERDPDVGSTAFASNGQIALAKIAERRPDVVVLDLEMPVLDGFATLGEIRRFDPTLPVILFSSVDERIAAATLEALSLGATDFVVKPSGGALEEAEAYVLEHLAPLVKGLAEPRPVRSTAAADHETRRPRRTEKIGVVVVGVSTGGPDALAVVVRSLPADLAAPVLIVQHMPPMFTRLLADRLARLSPLRIGEAADAHVLSPGDVLVAPGDRHLTVERAGQSVATRLSDGPPENSCRPAADVLFRSAAEVYGPGVLAVVLTGMGRDGLRGCQAVHTAGGHVVVQDPGTALIPSMPATVADAGLADAVVPLERVADEIARRVGARR